MSEDNPRRRSGERMSADRDPYEAVLDLVRSLEGQMTRGFDRIEEGMREAREGRSSCQEKTNHRLNSLEQWRSGLVAIYAVLSAVVSAATAWFMAGKH